MQEYNDGIYFSEDEVNLLRELRRGGNCESNPLIEKVLDKYYMLTNEN